MTEGKNERALTVTADNTALRNKSVQVTAIQRGVPLLQAQLLS